LWRAGSKRWALILEKDISKACDVKEIYAEAMCRFGKVDIIVNNAATDDEAGNDTIAIDTGDAVASRLTAWEVHPKCLVVRRAVSKGV